MANPVDQLQSTADTASGGRHLSIEMQLSDDGKLSAVNVNGETVIDKAATSIVKDMTPYTGNVPTDRLINALLDTWNSFVEHLPVLAIGILILVLTNAIARGVREGVKRIMMRFEARRGLCDVVGNLLFLSIWLGGFLIAVLVFDPSISIARIVAIVGLLSLALSFIFRDIMENFFAGLLLLWHFPFENGDYVEIITDSGTIAGEVVDVQLRMTLIREISNELVVVPNATIYKAPLRVDTWKPLRRDTIKVQVAYKEDIGEAREVIKQAVADCELVVDKVEVRVYATDFADSGCEFMIAWWAKSAPVDMWLAKDQVVEAVKKALDNAGIEIPYPHRKLIGLHNGDDDRLDDQTGSQNENKKKAPAKDASCDSNTENQSSD